MNFIKKIFDGKIDEEVHAQFIKFGKGAYGGRALLGLWKTKKVKIKGSSEFANDFVMFVANLGDVLFNGIIWSEEQLEGLSGKKRKGKWFYEVKDIKSENIKEFEDKVYCFLLNGEGEGIKLKIKIKLPKPGKSEGKIDSNFCQIELDEKYYNKVKEDFFWDMPEGKKISIKHKFVIEEIVMPKNEKDYTKIREMAKRKGKIIREADVDGKEIIKEKDFEI